MKSLVCLLIVFSSLMSALLPEVAEARYRHWWGVGFSHEHWMHGYWHHGDYLGRHGWWWVVGPTWYFYAAPVYPYPNVEVQPVYYVEVQNTPPPPPTVTTQAYSYYCERTKAYYPSVSSCDGGWLATPVSGPH